MLLTVENAPKRLDATSVPTVGGLPDTASSIVRILVCVIDVSTLLALFPIAEARCLLYVEVVCDPFLIPPK